MRKPYGKIFDSIEKIQIPKDCRLVTVGDRVSYSAITSGLEPSIIVYDGKERRGFISSDMREILEKFPARRILVSNPPGKISKDLWNTVKNCLSEKSKSKIFIIGEEDLAALPFVLESPKNTIILYGAFGKGIAFIDVNENIKNEWKELLNQMQKGP